MPIEQLVAAFVTLFVVIDPVGLAPLFVALTRGMTHSQRRVVALRSITIAFLLLALFAIAGERLLGAIGIGMPAFRISGGILLFLMAIDMLFEHRSQRRQERASADVPDPSVFPLATPLIAGPGSIAAVILLASQNSSDPLALANIGLIVIGILLITFLFFLAGQFIERLLGDTGVVVVTRLFGILLAALSVQFVIDGLRGLDVLGA